VTPVTSLITCTYNKYRLSCQHSLLRPIARIDKVLTEYQSSANASWLANAVTAQRHQRLDSCCHSISAQRGAKILTITVRPRVCHAIMSISLASIQDTPKEKALTSTDLMPVNNSALRLEWPVEDIAPDEEHGRLLVLALEIVVKDVVRAIGSVVKRIAHGLGFRNVEYIRW